MQIVREEGIKIKTNRYIDVSDFHEGLAAVQLNGKWGYIDKTGKEVIECKYDFASDFHEGLATVKLNDKYSTIDQTGKIPSLKFENEKFSNSNEDMTIGKVGDKWGYINKIKKTLIKYKYDCFSDFHVELAKVQINGIWCYINQTGNIAFELANIDKVSSETLNASDQNKLKTIVDKMKNSNHIELYYDLIIDGNRVSFSTLEEREQFEKELFIEEEDFEKQYVLSKK